MNEMPKKFILEQGENIEQSPLENNIATLYKNAREHEDFEVMGNLFEAVASFSDSLLQRYTKEELENVSAYHTLIRSGVPTSHILEELLHKDEIESAITAFVAEQELRIDAKPGA